ncbi:MAG: prepilin-type N-terminal cleavage/methylation domain-containing protein [Desulfosalsimonadaceae bacterium]|nr:prepilin-type N-terminal cleavage/methylation domain-containing protein [Desulfosalsimonadaceae bacterium]
MIFKIPHKTGGTNGESGFTLIELLIAIAIFAIGFMAVGAMQISSLNKTNSARRTTEAMALAEDQSEMLRALPFYDNDQDLDGDGAVEPFDILPDLDVDGNPHELDAPGPYTVRWEVDPTRPLPGYPAGVLDPANIVPNAMTILVWVTPDDRDADILAEIEFAKFCGKI